MNIDLMGEKEKLEIAMAVVYELQLDFKEKAAGLPERGGYKAAIEQAREDEATCRAAWNLLAERLRKLP